MAIDVKYPDFPFTDIQKKWIATLAGEEEWKPTQTTDGGLKTDTEEFCCLGVACELADPDGFGELMTVGNSNFYIFGDYDEENWGHEVPTDKVIEQMSLHDNSGEPQYGEFCRAETEFPETFIMPPLVEFNDNGHTFKAIAILLRTFPHFYFTNGGEPKKEIYGSAEALGKQLNAITDAAAIYSV